MPAYSVAYFPGGGSEAGGAPLGGLLGPGGNPPSPLAIRGVTVGQERLPFPFYAQFTDAEPRPDEPAEPGRAVQLFVSPDTLRKAILTLAAHGARVTASLPRGAGADAALAGVRALGSDGAPPEDEWQMISSHPLAAGLLTLRAGSLVESLLEAAGLVNPPPRVFPVPGAAAPSDSRGSKRRLLVGADVGGGG